MLLCVCSHSEHWSATFGYRMHGIINCIGVVVVVVVVDDDDDSYAWM